MNKYIQICCALAFSLFYLNNTLWAQANDNCANATPIIVGTTCVTNSYNSTGATSEATTVAPNPTCGFYQGGDVWFTAVVPASGALRFEFSGSGFNPQWALYEGTCGSFTQIACSQLNAQRTLDLSSYATQTIYIRVYGYNNASGGSFTMCVFEPTFPTNNNCVNALPITVGTSCTFGNFTTEYSTPEDVSVAANPSCGAYAGADVWFTTVVPASGIIRIEKTTNFAQTTFYSGTCGGFNEEACVLLNNTKILFFPTLAGQTIYIRAYAYNNDDGGDFTLCLWEPPLPANNDCANATPLTVGSSCTFANYTTAYATPESISVAPNPTCGAYSGADVWFTTVVPATGLLRIEKTTNYAQITIYSGTCGNFTEESCYLLNNSKTLILPSLAGQTIYIRAYSYNNDDGGDFTLCLFEPTLPVNDNCANAIALTIGNACTPANYTTEYATPEATNIAPNPSCGFYQGADVWFTAVVPPSGNLRIETTNTIDAQTAFYTGTCGNFNQFLCLQLNSNKTIRLDSLIGQTIYIRAYAYNSDDGGDFTLCLWEPTLPANDNCANAIPLTVGSSCTPATYTNDYATPEGTAISPNPTCGFYQGADVWYTAVVPASGALRIETTTTNAQTAIYTGTCGNFTQLICLQLNGDKTLELLSLAGQTLYIRTFAYSNDDGGNFTICVWEPVIPQNNNCADAFILPVGTTCTPDTFSNAYATTDTVGTAPNPTCGFYQGGDIWFKMAVPNTGNLLIERANFPGSNVQFALYDGTCGNFTQISCAQLRNSMYISDTSLAGDTVYLRMYSYNSEEGGPFTLCAYDTTCNLVNNYSYRDTICYGDTLMFGSRALTSAGIYTETFPTAGGCDSTVQLILTYYHGSIKQVSTSVCAGDSYTFPSGVTVNNITATTRDTSVLAASSISCDSTIITIVTVLNPSTRYDTVNICSGGNYTFPDGGTVNNITTTLNDTSILVAANTCDSIIITTVEVNNIYTRFDTASVCAGSSYTFPDGGSATNITASITDTSLLTSATACDSMIIVTVNVNSTYTLYDTASVCSGDSYTFPDGDTATNITTAITDTSVFLSVNSCDSIIITTVNVNSIYTRFDTASVCSGDDYTFPDGDVATNITSSIIDTSTLLTINFCDSIIITTVNVNSIYTRFDTAIVCSGDSYTFPDGGMATNITSTITDTSLLSGSTSCDSLIFTTVTVNSVYQVFDSINVCKGESYTFADGNTINNIQTGLTDTTIVPTSASCDSVVVTQITVIDIDISTSQIGASLSVNPTAGASYQWLDCNIGTTVSGATLANFSASANGDYAAIVTANGCADTTACLTVVGISVNELSLANIKVLPNPSNGDFVIDLAQSVTNSHLMVTDLLGKEVYSTSFGTSNLHQVHIDGAPGIYLLHISNSSESVTIKVLKQ